MASQIPKPFIYDRPVGGDEFLNRQRELRSIFSRLYNGESTLISGEPHIGKSSLLRKVNDEATQRKYLGDEASQFLFVFRNLHEIGIEYTPAAFWQEALAPLRDPEISETYARLAELALTTRYTHRWLERLFNRMGQQGERLVLLLDEFERLLEHPNFQDPRFFTLLRSMATRTDGLAIVSASRLGLYDLNKQGQALLASGSPLFNNMTELPLPPFDEQTVSLLLERGSFDPVERLHIRRVAGCHPFLLQTMAASLWEARGVAASTLPSDDVLACASKRFYERVALHFDEFWYTLEERTRPAAIILSLLQLGKWKHGDHFDFEAIEQLDIFGSELRRLAQQGLAEQVGVAWLFDSQKLPMWRGEPWTVSAQAFVWWVWEVVVAQKRQVPSVDQWLHKQGYRFLLTQAQWDELVSRVRSGMSWSVERVMRATQPSVVNPPES